MELLKHKIINKVDLNRFLISISGILFLVFGFVNHYIIGYESVDILHHRYVFTCMFFLTVIFSFFFERIKNNLYSIMVVFCYLTMTYFNYVGYLTSFVFDHTLAIIATFIVTSIFISKLNQLYVFVVYNLLIFFVSVTLTDYLLVNFHTLILIYVMLSIGLVFMVGNQLKYSDLIDKSQANLLAIFNNTNQTITLLDLDYKILKFNNKSKEIAAQFNAKSISIGDDFLSFIPDDKIEFYVSQIEKCKQGVEVIYEEIITGPNYKKLYYEFKFSPIYSSSKELFAIALFTMDVTEKKDSINALISSRDNLEKLFNLSTVPLVISRYRDSQIVTANESMVKLMNYPSMDFENLDGSIFYKNIEDRNLIREKIIKNGFVDNYELQISKHNQEVFWGLLSAKIFQYNDETCLLISINDISTLKSIEIELRKSKEDAEEALKIKSQFLSVMSHEIRTPMNAVIGITELLLSNEPREDQILNLNTLKFSSNNLLGIINEILDLSKIESGKMEFEFIPINIVTLANNIKASFQTQIKQKNIYFNIEIDPNITLQILSDLTRLSQIINNLIGNAIKFTNSGGILLKIELINNVQHKYTLKFNVLDTGIGISSDKLDSIFDNFTQGSSDTTRKYGGTGLGLSITKKLLKIMKSDIKVQSEIDKGSNFFFELEVDTIDEKLTEKADEIILNEDFRGIKILVAEDNDINILIISQFLKKWKIDFDIAKDGREAVDLVAQNDYKLVLMDMQMPELDGIEASLEIRKMGGKYLDLNIVILSAAVEFEIKKQMQLAKINEYIAKPFVPEELYKVIQKYCI